MEFNENINNLPRHLLDLIVEQPYEDYTPQDHAVWRYVMRQNVKYLSRVAHGSYLNGLKQTGINIEQIPHMYGMNRILKEIGWAAVTVDGFIPPAAFMEFQEHKVLVIAADIRPINQINYTPAPDIIHEAAGHAPIIASEEYAEYLRVFGEIGRKAFSSALDYKMYSAIRHLSILKADPYTPTEEITRAETDLSILKKNPGEPSEMAQIRNLHWWTVEYGLIGDLKNPKIYGAGLLSSIGESYNCLQDHVKKLPYTIEAADVGFDITTQQPQLFVTPNFEHLTKVLNEFAENMALRKGGAEGIFKAIGSDNVATFAYSSGLQVSGNITYFWALDTDLIYVKTSGPTSLNFNFKQLKGHDKKYHANGYSSPVGKLAGINTPLEDFDSTQLEREGILTGRQVTLNFESGVTVKGRLDNILRKKGKIILMTFNNCIVTTEGDILFEPDWGTYDMAVGEKVTSVFSGPADPDAFELKYEVPKEKTHKIQYSETDKELHTLYQEVRNIRETGKGFNRIPVILNAIKIFYPDEWLLPLEIFELTKKLNTGINPKEVEYLLKIKLSKNERIKRLIENGMQLI